MTTSIDKPLRYRGQFPVRILGAILLSACAVMLVLGLTVLEDKLHGPRYALYWSWCFLITLIAILVALLDLILVRRASRQARRQLFHDQFNRP